jgi:hypothetical protein
MAPADGVLFPFQRRSNERSLNATTKLHGAATQKTTSFIYTPWKHGITYNQEPVWVGNTAVDTSLCDQTSTLKMEAAYPPKRWFPITKLHCATTQQTTTYNTYSEFYSAGLRSGWSVVQFPAGSGHFSLHHCVQIGSGAYPASYPIPGDLSLRTRRPGCETDYSSPCSTEVKNAWIYTSNLSIHLHGVVLS